MKISFISGKGGVGKSTVAAALAYKHSIQGQRTLLIELNEFSFYKPYFELEKVDFQPKKISENLWVAQWTAKDCLREYIHHLVKVESLTSLFFKNPVTTALLNVAPGLNEISILGKITSGPPRNVGPKLPFDSLIVDGFASGHFLSMMRAPIGLAKSVRLGPMGEQARAISDVLKDSNICAYYLVAIPEELAVTECLELAETLRSEFSLQPILILNEALEAPSEPTARLNKLINHIDSQKFYKKDFQICLPLVLSTAPWEIIKSLAKDLP